MDLQHNNRALREKHLTDFLEICLETQELQENEELNYVKKKNEQNRAGALRICPTSICPEAEYKPEVGQDILVTGFMGSAGADVLARFERERLAKALPELFIDKALREIPTGFEDLLKLLQEQKTWEKYGISYIALIGEGGMYKTLYDLGKESGIGFTINYPEVPIKQQTVEFCEVFEADPWEFFTAASLLIVCDKGPALARRIREIEEEPELITTREKEKMNCEVCGYMTKGKDKFIAHKDQMSRVNRPKPDVLLSILKEHFCMENE